MSWLKRLFVVGALGVSAWMYTDHGKNFVVTEIPRIVQHQTHQENLQTYEILKEQHKTCLDDMRAIADLTHMLSVKFASNRQVMKQCAALHDNMNLARTELANSLVPLQKIHDMATPNEFKDVLSQYAQRKANVATSVVETAKIVDDCVKTAFPLGAPTDIVHLTQAVHEIANRVQ